MLRGMYDFQSSAATTLPFLANEPLLYLGTHPLDNNWLKASNALGKTGLVPVNYVTIDHDFTGDVVMEFLNGAIRLAQRDKSLKIDELLKLRDRILTPSTDIKDQVIELEDEIRRTRQIAISELGNVDMSYVPRNEQSITRRSHGSHSNTHQTTADSAPIASTSRSEPAIPHRRKNVPHNRQGPSSSSAVTQEGISGNRNHSRNHQCPSSGLAGSAANEVDRDDLLDVGGRGDLEPLCSPVMSPVVSPTAAELEMEVLTMTIEDSPPVASTSTGSNGRSNSYPFENHVVDYSSPANSRLAGEMIDGVRNTTGLSHEMSQIAVQTVLEFLQSNFAEMAAPLNSLMGYLEAPCAIRNFPDIIRQSPDAAKLKELFSVLTECKEDEQQRSWSLHEDEKMILGTIAELNAILTNADHSISKYVMQESHYTNVHALALYYQMETRRSIRQVLRDSCAFISIIDKKAMNVLANSVLPMELAREMQADAADKTKLYSCASLLCILLSSGEPMPIVHYEHVGSEFISFILNAIESNSPEDDERLVDTLISLVLAYNLQFDSPKINFSILALSQMTNAPHFTQRIIYLLNWGKDPVSDEMPFNTSPVNSVCKLLIDMFCCPLTANLFYTNDVKVLIDIIIRNLTDLGAGDKKKSSYLTLIRMILRNTSYQEHQHRKDDLCQCFTTVLLEDDPMSVPDQRLIREIYLEFPLLNK